MKSLSNIHVDGDTRCLTSGVCFLKSTRDARHCADESICALDYKVRTGRYPMQSRDDLLDRNENVDACS